MITGASGETRALADPAFVREVNSLGLSVEGGGDAVVTAASAVNQAGNTVMTFNDAGDHVLRRGGDLGGAPKWFVVSNDGAAMSS